MYERYEARLQLERIIRPTKNYVVDTRYGIIVLLVVYVS
jgi:hypothetical protein